MKQFLKAVLPAIALAAISLLTLSGVGDATLFSESLQVTSQAGSTAEWYTAGANPQRTSWVSAEAPGALKPAWFAKIDPYISQKIQIIAANNTLYLSTAQGLYALDLTQSGRVKWIYPTDLPLGHSPTIDGGVAYVGGYDRKLHALDANTGAGRWTFTAGAGFDTNPLVVNGTVYLGNRDGYFYAVNAADGQLRWKFQTGGPINYSAAYANNTVYFASDDMYAYALDATTGALKWKSAKLPGDGFHSYWPVIHKNLVVFSGSPNYRVSIDPFAGHLRELDKNEAFLNAAGDPKGTLIGTTATFNPAGTEPGDWAAGTKTLNGTAITSYFENKAHRRTILYLDQATGQEFTFDSDGDGKQEYAPFLFAGPKSGNRYPPVVGQDGVVYQQNAYLSDQWIPGGNVTGWKVGTPFLSLPSGSWKAQDEPLGFSVGGRYMYWKLMGERAAGSFDLSTSAQDEVLYFDDGSNRIKDKVPEVFLRDGKLWEFAYWKHGDQSPPIPYNGKLYMIVNNAVVAFDSVGGAPNTGSIPTGVTTGDTAANLLKASVLPGANVKVTADGSNWPALVQQETYYSTSSAPGDRPRYFRHFFVRGSDAASPTSLDVSQPVGAAGSFTTHFNSTDLLKSWVSPHSPIVLFNNTTGLYDLSGPLVGMAYASSSGVKVVNGTGTIAGSGMSESWILVWDATNSHRWSPVLLSLQKRPSQVQLSSSGLRITYSGAAGYMSATPFYGMSDPRNQEISTWQQGLPSQAVDRSRLLNRVSKSFPSATTESLSIDATTKDATLTYSHSYIDVQDDWGTSTLKLAYLPPEVALAAWNGSPIRINGQALDRHRDLDYPVEVGRVAGVENSSTATVTIPGVAKYWRDSLPASPSVTSGDPVAARLAGEVQKMVNAGHLRPSYANIGLWHNYARDRMGYNEADYWHNPADTQYTLIRALPYLSDPLKTQVRSYLQQEYQSYPPYSVVHVGWNSGASRDSYDLPPEVSAAAASYGPRTSAASYLWSFPPYNFYALWLYADSFGGASTAFNNSKSRLEAPKYPFSMPYMLNSYLAGYVGYLRLAQLAGAGAQPDVEKTMVKLFITRAALSKYQDSLARSGFEYGGYKWAVNIHDRGRGEIFFKPVMSGSLWNQLPLYGFPVSSLYFGSGLWAGGDYAFTLDFLNLVPEVAQFLRDYAFQETQAAVLDYTTVRAPYWVASRAEETGGEGTIQPLFDKWAYFQAKAMALGDPRSELEKYLDVPAAAVGDLYFIQNLTSTLAAGAGAPAPTPVPTSATTPTPAGTVSPTATQTPGATPSPTVPPSSGLGISQVTSNASSVPLYEKFELTFNVNNSVATNPQFSYDPAPPAGIPAGTGITVEGLFLPPGQSDWSKALAFPGFLYQDYQRQQIGGQEWLHPQGSPVWKVRFAPKLQGTWQYRVRAQDASINAPGVSPAPNWVQSPVYSLTATAPNPGNHGFLEVSKTDPRQFAFTDGSPFVGLGHNVSFSDSNFSYDAEAKLAQYAANGANFFRVWMSRASIAGSAWGPWAWFNGPTYGGYIPDSGLQNAPSGSGYDFAFELNHQWGRDLIFNGWTQGKIAVKPNTTYELSVTALANNVTGPRNPANPNYGFTVKLGPWADQGVDSLNSVANLVPYLRNSGWTTLKGTVTTKSGQYFLDFLYLMLENASGGKANIAQVSLREALTGGGLGPDILDKSRGDMHMDFNQQNSWAWDYTLEQAAQKGVYLKLVGLEKNDRVWNRINLDGTMGTSDNANDNFYAARDTKVRRLHEYYWRYLAARWGYSTAVHSWELLNEGDPNSYRHGSMANNFSWWIHFLTSGRHLATTSTWTSYPVSNLWGDPGYSNIDYADIHAYPDTSPVYLDSHDAAQLHTAITDYVRGFGLLKPTVRGETGIGSTAAGQDPALARDTRGVWLHNLAWAQIDGLPDLYWWSDKIEGNNLYFQFKPFRDFMEGIPLDNGRYQKVQAVASDGNVRTVGLQDTAAGRAHLWIQNRSHTWWNVVNGTSWGRLNGTVSVAGFAPNTAYPVELWLFDDPGNLTRQQITLTSDGSGQLTVNLSSLSSTVTDLGVKIGSYSTVPPPPTATVVLPPPSTATPVASPTPAATSTPAATATSLPTATATPMPTATPTRVATASPTPASAPPTPIPSPTPGPTSTIAELLGYWKLDEGSGTAARDDSGKGNHGTLLNGPAWIGGYSGFGLGFDGVNDHVQVPSSDTLSPLTSTGEITLAAWVNLSTRPSSSRQPVVTKGSAGNWEYALTVHNNGKVGFTVWQPNGSVYSESVGGKFGFNEWHRLVGTAKAGQYVRIYLDGNLVSENTGQNGALGKGTSPLYFARRGDDQYLNTKLDDVRLYNRALSASEILGLNR